MKTKLTMPVEIYTKKRLAEFAEAEAELGEFLLHRQAASIRAQAKPNATGQGHGRKGVKRREARKKTSSV